MSIPGSGLSFGGGPGGSTRFTQTRGRLGGGVNNGVNYPSPFFDIAHTYLPTTVKAMFRWCRYYFLTNPIINATVFKLSEYPITEIEIDHQDKKVANKWKEYFEDHLNYRAFQIECGLDYNTYGNCLTSLNFPFKKYLTCRRCKYQAEAKRIRPHWVFTNYEFRLSCPQCGELGTADSKDQYYRNESGVRVMRWSPEDVEISYSDLTGEYTYFYNIPPGVRNDVIIGKKDAVEQVPEVFIQALRQQKGVVFSKDLFFHLRRPTLADQDRGWGLPLLLPCLKDTFYLQIMKKAQEAILLEHIVPLRILFPQAGSGTSDPYCVTPDTLVETIDGLRPASEIAEGDYLRSHTGAWRHVEGIKARQVGVNEKVYKVVVDSLPGFPFKVSEEHPILAVPRTSQKRGRANQAWVDPAFIPIKDLRVGDYVAYPANRARSNAGSVDLGAYTQRAVTEDFVYRSLSQHAAEAYEWLEMNGDYKFAWGERKEFLHERGWEEADFEVAAAMRAEGAIDRMPRHIPLKKELASLVGFFLAEGSLKGGLPTFALGSTEHWIADEIMHAATALGFRGTTRYESKLCNGLTVDVQDVLLGDLLSGLCGCGFATKRFPQELAEASDRAVLNTLRALFAGDGCDFSTDTNRVALKMSNPSIVLEARRLLLSFGLIGGITKEVPKEGAISKSPAFHLAYNGEQADALRVLFAHGELPTPLPWSKLGVLRGGYVLHRIASVAEVDEPTVIGFQMAEDKSFCVAGVATHNTTINLVDWRDHVATEIARWRYDPNYIPILPLPVGNQTIGGDGRALLMVQEMQQMGEQLINGMQVPLEFIKGGLSYAGTNISMRMLENQFIVYLSRHTRMAKWVMRSVADYLQWPLADIRFKPFKMADDIQRKAFLFQLNQAGKVSDTTLLMDSDLDQEKEDQIMERETVGRMSATKKQQLAQAELQGEQQVIMMKMQAKAQQELAAATASPVAPGEPGGPEGGATPSGGMLAPASPMAEMSSPLNAGQNMGMGSGPTQAGQNVAMGGTSIITMAQTLAMQLSQMDPAQQLLAVKKLREQSPELADLVLQMLQSMPNQQQQQQAAEAAAAVGAPAAPDVTDSLGANGKAAVQVDMRPLPEKLPPRRAAGTV